MQKYDKIQVKYMEGTLEMLILSINEHHLICECQDRIVIVSNDLEYITNVLDLKEL